jgi:DNA modification methylase
MSSDSVAAEFRSRLEEVMAAEELVFPPTLGFGDYKPYLDHALAHPAKANTKLLEFLILNFTNEGDIVLDPMAGSGSTGVVAALHGRNAIQVDIEPRFYEWMEVAREKVERTITLAPKGWIKNILGDARRLSELLDQADVIITSPPYADAKRGGEADVEAMVERWDKTFREAGEKWNSWGRTWATPGRARSLQALGSGYSNSPDNIGNLPFGNVDIIITSPPFGDCQHDYKHGLKVLGPNFKGRKALENRLKIEVSPDNIGSLPFGEVLDDGRVEELVSKLMRGGKPTYLSEMLKVYREMWRVLKPGGRAIIIIKPFIRNKRVIDLPYYTYLLMRLCGFELEKLYKLRLGRQSFWRVLFYRKHPEVPRIAHEYVLVCRKNSGALSDG